MQNLPLEAKIIKTQQRIREWYEYWDGEVYVSFSGGKDSTVLLNLIRELYPNVPAVFINTGLEYPEIVEFVRSIKNVVELRPKINFKKVIETYGYPVISKKNARFIRDLQNPTEKNKITRNLRLTGFNQNGKFCPSMILPKKYLYLVNAPFKISEQCCDIMKKEPFHRYQKETQRKPIIGTMASESDIRASDYRKQGCNAYHLNEPKSQPMSFWTEQDVLQYLKQTKIPYASVYGDIIEDENGKLITTGEHRTGCIFCMFGVHLEKEPNRFQRMKITHPQLYNYCMNKLGLKEVLDYINVKYD